MEDSEKNNLELNPFNDVAVNCESRQVASLSVVGQDLFQFGYIVRSKMHWVDSFRPHSLQRHKLDKCRYGFPFSLSFSAEAVPEPAGTLNKTFN